MKILLATDGSEYSEDAARVLTRFRFSSLDEIVVLHVVTSVPYEDDYKAQMKHYFKKVSPGIRKASVDILKPVTARITSVEEEGAPDEIIIKTAVDSAVDLIVMGARGVKGIKSFFIGSVTRAVAINSPRPVLVTRPYQWKADKGMKVLFATDGSPSADATASLLASMPFPRDTELMLMSIATSAIADIPEKYAGEIDEEMREYAARAKERNYRAAEAVLEKAGAMLAERFGMVNRVIKTGDPAMEILHEAAAAKADLIAVGSRGLRGIKGMLGSVSRRVLGHSNCPVLIGKGTS